MTEPSQIVTSIYSPGNALGQYRNSNAFAAIKNVSIYEHDNLDLLLGATRGL